MRLLAAGVDSTVIAPWCTAGRPHRALVTVKKNRAWVIRNCEAVLYLTSLAATQTSPQNLLAGVRGHWRVEGLHWLRDVVWHEDHSLLRTGNAPQVMSTITNLVITLFRIQGVTKYAAETSPSQSGGDGPSAARSLAGSKIVSTWTPAVATAASRSDASMG
jgi:predicted transposase YbfD/YdcC